MNESCILKNIHFDDLIIPFSDYQGFYYQKNEERYTLQWQAKACNEYACENDDIKAELVASYCKDYVKWTISINVKTDEDLDIIGLQTGIDTCMEEYPSWNDKFFPTMLRCEKTHFWSCFISPLGKSFVLLSPQAVSSYSLDYKKPKGYYYGHRINTVNIDFVNSGKLPSRHPNVCINKGETLERDLYFVPLKKKEDIFEKAWAICKIPLIMIERTALNVGDYIKFSVNTSDCKEIQVFSPNGEPFDIQNPVSVPGVYKILLVDNSDKVTEACVSVLKPYGWYLRQARKEAWQKPQKATTHTEGWYGYFSAFLAKKHYPDDTLDSLLDKSFFEVSSLIFDFNTAMPTLSPERIQNISSFIELLLDRYEADPENNADSLLLASRFGDWIVSRQKEDGAYYRNGKLHYTCVEYPAKTLLELSFAEKGILPKKSKEHYDSAGKAVENLVELLECIGTEGEHTLEDGMIACSALQIAAYALTLPMDKRDKYIDAAEHMLNVHGCLEQSIIPDSRMRGGTLRFWEAQYDVLIKGNLMNSPHGWSAWTAYATYYLYLLTGKKDYLVRTVNTLGSCLQLMSYEGELRWSFVSDPQICTEVFVPDYSKPVKDGYVHISGEKGAYSGKYEKITLGEQYIDMISGWYRVSEDEKRVGAYLYCPLVLPSGHEKRSTQGGCCDNDVHEVFKCMEEVLLKKAFVIEEEPNVFSGWNCRVISDGGRLIVESFDETETLHINIKENKDIVFDGTIIAENIKGMCFLNLR